MARPPRTIHVEATTLKEMVNKINRKTSYFQKGMIQKHSDHYSVMLMKRSKNYVQN